LKALPFLFSLLQLNHLSKGYGFRGQGQATLFAAAAQAPVRAGCAPRLHPGSQKIAWR
jgi:hypothetical protein